jgi:ribosomal protein S21
MLINYAKFLKNNIDQTKSINNTEMGKALQTSQEFEMARLRYFVGAIDRQGEQIPKAQIYFSTSEIAKSYASRKDEPTRSDPSGKMAEQGFIRNINLPIKLEVKDMEGTTNITATRTRLESLSKDIKNIAIGRSSPLGVAPSPITRAKTFSSLDGSIQKLGDGSVAEKLREKIKTPYATYAPEVDRALNQKLIIGKNSIERRMANIEKSLFGIDNGRTFNTSDALSETPNKKENALIEYVGFLQDKISLVKKEIKIAENDNSEQADYKKLKLQKLQLGLFGEIGKIRGLFPEMSQEEKRKEALKLTETIDPRLVSINTTNGRVYARGPDGKDTNFRISRQSTRDSVDKKIESIVRSVNKEERLLERDVSITQMLGIEPKKGLLTQKPRRIGQGTIFRPTTDSGGR